MRHRKSMIGIIASTILAGTLVATAPAAEAASLPTFVDVSTNRSDFNRTVDPAPYFSVKTKAMAGSGRGLIGKAILFVNGERQRWHRLRQGNSLFRVDRSDLLDNRTVRIEVRIYPADERRRDRSVSVYATDVPRGQHILNKALSQVGDPYRYGADGPGSFDCSGLVQYAARVVGRSLPHSSSGIRDVGNRVSSAKPGDVLYTPGHVSVYAGNGKVVEAARPGTRVRVVSIWQRNWVAVRV